MKNFGPESRAFAHTMISQYRAGTITREEAEAAVNAASSSYREKDYFFNSGFRNALERGSEVRLVRGGIGEQVFEPLLRSKQKQQKLSPQEERALEIRRHAAAIIENTRKLDGWGVSHNSRHRIQTRIKSRVGKLLELGITPNMHFKEVFSPTALFDPLILAERAAGKILHNLDVKIDEWQVFPEESRRTLSINFRKTPSQVAPVPLRLMIAA